jgi:hypothetical protein
MYNHEMNRAGMGSLRSLVGVLLVGVPIAGLLLFLAEDSPLVFGTSLAAITGIGLFWQQSRARMSRWRAALDAYADREITLAAIRDRRHQLKRLEHPSIPKRGAI